MGARSYPPYLICRTNVQVYKGQWRGAQVAVKLFEQVELNEVDEATLDSLRREVSLRTAFFLSLGRITELPSSRLSYSRGYVIIPMW